MTSSAAGAPALELKGIVKEYEQNRVLKGVSLSVREGEIHALVGENGAGKSTLMNILFGMPVIWETGGYEGEVLLGGAPARFQSPAEAMEAGIGMVHQEFMLLPGFRVAENIKLNREPTLPNPASRVLGKKLESLDVARMRADARRALDAVGLGIDEWILVAGLPVGHMQFIEIAREVDKERLKLLIFDEPTAVLTESDAEKLLDIMRGLASKGHAILFITHRLDEVLAVANRITVLRDGEVVGTPDPKTTTVARIAELMVGVVRRRAVRGKAVVEVSVAVGIAQGERHGREQLVAERDGILPYGLSVRRAADHDHRHERPEGVDDELAGRCRRLRGHDDQPIEREPLRLGLEPDDAIAERVPVVRRLHEITEEDVADPAVSSGNIA